MWQLVLATSKHRSLGLSSDVVGFQSEEHFNSFKSLPTPNSYLSVSSKKRVCTFSRETTFTESFLPMFLQHQGGKRVHNKLEISQGRQLETFD